MKKNTNPVSYEKSERGAFLLTAMFFVSAAAMGTIGVASYVQQQGLLERKTGESIQAHYVAQGAMNRIKAELKADPGLLQNPTSSMKHGALGCGTYDVVYTDTSDGGVCVVTTAAVNGTSTVLRMYAKAPQGGVSVGFDKAIFSEHDVALGGNTSVKGNGTVHSNANASADGSSYLEGNLTAHGKASAGEAVEIIVELELEESYSIFFEEEEETKETAAGDEAGEEPTGAKKGVAGQVVSGADYEYFPRLHYKYYYEIAEKNGTVLEGDQHFRSKMNPNGGVIWVNGDVNIGNGTKIYGCLVATGDIKATSKAGVFLPHKLEDGNNAPALVSVNGNIHMTAQSQLVGLVYAGTGSVKFTGAWKNELRGAIYAWDYIHLAGGAGLTYDPDVVGGYGDGVHDQETDVKIMAMEK